MPQTPNLPNIVFPHVPAASARNTVHNLPGPAHLLSVDLERPLPPSLGSTLDDAFGFVNSAWCRAGERKVEGEEVWWFVDEAQQWGGVGRYKREEWIVFTMTGLQCIAHPWIQDYVEIGYVCKYAYNDTQQHQSNPNLPFISYCSFSPIWKISQHIPCSPA